MQHPIKDFALFSVWLVRFRTWFVAALVVEMVTRALAVSAQSPLPAYYSTGGVFQVTQPATATAGGSVTAGVNAADGNFSTFATLQTDGRLNVGVPVALRLKLAGEAPAGYRAGVVLANASSTLDLAVLGAVTLRTYLTSAGPTPREQKVVRLDLLQAALGANDLPTQLEFTSALSFDAVEIEFVSALNVVRSFNIFYAYGVTPGVQTRATGYLSRFAAPVANREYSAAVSTAVLCVNARVTNPERVADNDLTNFATLRSTVGVACRPEVQALLAEVPAGGVPAGHHAGFVIGQAGLLDVGVLSGLELTTYLGNTPVETRTGFGLLDLTLLPGNKAHVSFKTGAGKPFDGVRIARVGLLTAVDDLHVYYAFGLDPTFFVNSTPVLSDFSAPQANTDYFASAPQAISVRLNIGVPPFIVSSDVNLTLSNVENPQLAADAVIPTTRITTNYAQLNTLGLGALNLSSLLTLANPLTTSATASLKLRLRGTGRAGNRVGMVISQGSGLLDLTALERLTVATYDADNRLIESKSGSSLLSTTLLGTSDLFRVSFLASRDFAYVQLTVTSLAAVVSNTRVYYAFAEDVPIFWVGSPLPVELTSFRGRWTNGAAALNWATATERNSSHFVVERSTGRDAAFRAVGQVEAAGNTSSAQAYQLRDADAGAQGVALLYYRLRQVDVDGTQVFSSVISVAVGLPAAAAPRLEVFPNPATEAAAVMVRCPNLAAGGTVLTYSQLGQLVSQQAVTEAAAPLRLPALAPGLYHVVLRNAAGQGVATQRLVLANY
ncbi:hypothetical protein [Hymenobacter arizonensis]|uniref:Por secretion system C-terminal sorting domain-containing protein n=1 Tax=Hymenobacter arizonensis TaxID=1227077 RepID=A0A1I5WUT9_HYMAR|nr:hypothetical protein [Hymenobacter arizonensis]SFQ23464.1 Por secretion system C-terminal sorting domain-containing protein [Hymenobacter arizonensis]